MSYHIRLRPDLRTANGEVQDIMIEDRYAGTLILVFREGHRLAGSVQLDSQSVPEDAEEEILTYVKQYLLQFRDAVDAEHIDVLLTWGEVESVLGDEDGYEEDTLPLTSESIIPEPAPLFLYEDESGEMQIELISAGRYVSQYELQNGKGQTIAHAVLKQYGTDIQGEVNWLKEPLEEEIDSAEELLVAEVDDGEIDTITLEMKYKDNRITILELVRQDSHTASDEAEGPDWDEDGVELLSILDHDQEEIEDSCYVRLIRHDREIVSYDLFLQEHGGLPVASATVDISEAAVSGYIDFYIELSEEQHQDLVIALSKEVEKEIEVKQLHITMLYRNVVIDEMLLTSEED